VSNLHLALVLRGHSLCEVLSGSLQSIETPADGCSRRPDKTQRKWPAALLNGYSFVFRLKEQICLRTQSLHVHNEICFANMHQSQILPGTS
jgi:hypothetical protein